VNSSELIYEVIEGGINPAAKPSGPHGEHEKRTGRRDEAWADWYAAYMVAEQADEKPPL